MRGFLVVLRLVVVAFALVAGGRALYQNRDKLRSGLRSLRGTNGLKVLASKIPTGRLTGSVGALRGLSAHLARQK